MNTTLRYIGYSAVSLLLGWLSSMGGESDVLHTISDNLFQFLITILVLYITLSNLVYGQLVLIKTKLKQEISTGIIALKRNIKVMFSIIGADFIIFVILNTLPLKLFKLISRC